MQCDSPVGLTGTRSPLSCVCAKQIVKPASFDMCLHKLENGLRISLILDKYMKNLLNCSVSFRNQ